MRTRDAYIGVRPAFEGRYSREGTETGFDVVAVDREGKQVARAAVDYTIEHISYAYQWYVVDGRWRWQGISNKRVIEADQLDLKADAPVRLSKRLPWGQYRLTVTDRQRQHLDHHGLLCRLVRRRGQQRGTGAGYIARRRRQAELRAGRESAAAHRGAICRPGPGRDRHRPHARRPTLSPWRRAARMSRSR